MTKIIVHLREKERNALDELAQREMREPRDQAALIIRQEPVHQGMLAEQSKLQRPGYATQQAEENGK